MSSNRIVFSMLILALIAAWVGLPRVASATPSAAEKPVSSGTEPAPPPSATPAPTAPTPSVDATIEVGRHRAADGTWFTYEKKIVDGQDVMVYTQGERVLDQAGFEQYEMDHAPPLMDQALIAHAAAQTPPDAPLDLLIWLRERQGGRIAHEVRAAHAPAIEALAEQIRAIHRSVRPNTLLGPDEERDFVAGLADGDDLLTPQQRTLVDDLGAQIEVADNALRAELRSRIDDAVADDQAAIASVITSLSGVVVGTVPIANAVSARLPANRLDQLATDPRIARIELTPTVEPELDLQISSLGVDTGFHANGICGGIWDAGVLDSGIQQNHPRLNPGSWISTFGTTDSDGHGTAVAGIILSDDATFRGFAHCLDAMLVGSFGGGSVMSHANWMVSTAAQDPEAINLSGGYGIANDTDYSTFDQFWDGLVDDNSVLVCKSTGNSNDNDPEGDHNNNITHPAPAYNLMAVANIYDQNTTTRTDDVITFDSSRGPTLNGRKKPDMAAPGTNTATTNNDWATAADFINFGGTSAAAPKCTAATVLLTELRGSDTPIANKAVLLNTADTWSDNGTPGVSGDDGATTGSQWNKTYGWGYMDLWEAWFNGLDVFTGTVDDGVTPPGPDYRLYRGNLFADEKATLVWNRHVGFNGASAPIAVENLTDLDLLLYDLDGNQLANAHEGPNNVEQIAAASSGSYVLKVDVFGTIDPDVGVESFALATEENWVTATGPSFDFGGSFTAVSPNQNFDINLSVINNGDIGSTTNNITLNVPPGYTVVSGANPQPIGAIPVGGSAPASWTVRAACSTGLGITVPQNNATSVGENFFGETTLFASPTTTTLTDDTVVTSSSIPRTYDFSVVGFDWTGVALNPQGADHDVWADDDLCITSPYQTSTLTGGTIDFTMTNGVSYGAGTHYALARFGSPSTYSIESDQADDLSAGGSVVVHFTASEIIEVFEVSLNVGTSILIRADVTSGNTDVALFGYRPDLSDGDRASATYVSTSTGPGGTEDVLFTAPVTGNYGFAVINENATAGTVTFSALPLLFADGFETGSTSAWDNTVPDP